MIGPIKTGRNRSEIIAKLTDDGFGSVSAADCRNWNGEMGAMAHCAIRADSNDSSGYFRNPIYTFRCAESNAEGINTIQCLSDVITRPSQGGRTKETEREAEGGWEAGRGKRGGGVGGEGGGRQMICSATDWFLYGPRAVEAAWLCVFIGAGIGSSGNIRCTSSRRPLAPGFGTDGHQRASLGSTQSSGRRPRDATPS